MRASVKNEFVQGMENNAAQSEMMMTAISCLLNVRDESIGTKRHGFEIFGVLKHDYAFERCRMEYSPDGPEVEGDKDDESGEEWCDEDRFADLQQMRIYESALCRPKKAYNLSLDTMTFLRQGK